MRLKNHKLVFGILTVFLLLAIIFIIILFKKTGESENNLTSNNNTTTKKFESSVIYGEVTEEDFATQEEHHDTSAPSHDLGETTPTIFETNKNTKNIGSYTLSPPSILQNSEFSGMNRKIIGLYKGYVFLYRNGNEIIYYNPVDKKTYSLTDNVTNAFPNLNTSNILFEQKLEKGFNLYHYDFIKNKDGFENIVTLASSAVDFGKQGDFNYFSIKEQPNTYFYQPMPKSSLSSEEIGFRDFESNLSQPYKSGLISYLKEDNSLYELQFGSSPEKLFGLPNYSDFKYLVHLKVNPFRTDKLIYIASFSNIEDDLVGKRVIINGTNSPDLENITNVEWIDGESIIYTIDSEDGELYLYNFRTTEKYVLARNIATFGYNYEEHSIYFIEASENTVKKITIEKK